MTPAFRADRRPWRPVVSFFVCREVDHVVL
jgi:hypothetical protein